MEDKQNGYLTSFIDFLSYYYGKIIYEDNRFIFKGVNENGKEFSISLQVRDTYAQLDAVCYLEGFNARCKTLDQFEDMLKHCLKVCKPKGKEYAQTSLF